MLIIIPVAGALFTHNALAASTLGKRSGNGTPQAVLSADDGPTPHDTWRDVDISEGWADPRINGGRFLDVGRLLVGS
jgi:hypothetical protein